MKFTYFEGPQDEMGGFRGTEVPCDLCGKTTACFSLDFADCEELFPTGGRLSSDQRQGKLGCYDCLCIGRFEFSHTTEVGTLLSPRFLQQYPDLDLPLPPVEFPKSAITQLRRTPTYISWQGEESSPWLVHCGDFMVYLGSWQPADFLRNAPNGDGRALFIEMTDPEQCELWDAAARDRGEEHPSDWYAAYYAFRCRHCGKLRGQWDMP